MSVDGQAITAYKSTTGTTTTMTQLAADLNTANQALTTSARGDFVGDNGAGTITFVFDDAVATLTKLQMR